MYVCIINIHKERYKYIITVEKNCILKILLELQMYGFRQITSSCDMDDLNNTRGISEKTDFVTNIQ